MRVSLLRIAALFLGTSVASCKTKPPESPVLAAPPAPPEAYWTNASRKVCLVLSVGGPKGVAHLGAIEAVKRARGQVGCVVGTSFGALAGSIYATAPSEPAPDRYLRFIDAYVAQTRADKEDGAVGGALLAALVAGALTGGLGWAAAAGVAGGMAGADGVKEADQRRFVSVMQRFYGGVTIERLPLPFGTLYHQKSNYGLRPQVATSGDLAHAVGASVANPFIFADVDVRTSSSMDPGADRVMAVPVEDACRLFPDAGLIVINVTDDAAFFSNAMRCPMLEIRVPLPAAGAQAMMRGPLFEMYVKAGFDTTAQVLAANR